MNIIDLIKLVLKHKVLLVTAPLLMAILAIVLTRNPKLDYETQAFIYTGIATGSSIEMSKRFDRNASNASFDNLLNIIESRETGEEVAVRLLTQHLLLEEPTSEYISKEHFDELKELVPADIYNYLEITESVVEQDSSGIIPKGISRRDYERSVKNLMDLKKSSNDNFIYELLNYPHPHYSLEAISEVSVVRIGGSDLIKMSYTTSDPGICKQTLDILIEVCSRKYKAFRESGSNAVVEYFEKQLIQTESKLKRAEKELLQYKQENGIINYYEQSKAVAVVREDMEVAYKNKLAQLAGSEASKRRLEEGLKVNGEIEQLSQEVIDDKERIGELKYQIVLAQAKSDGSPESLALINSIKSEVEKLELETNIKVNKLYALNNSVDGVPMNRMMPEWINNMVNTENLAAEVDLMTKQSQEFLKEVEKYAPYGANIKRMERKIRVIEEEYLEILHGLNLAKIKVQDTQIAGNLVTVDAPFFPLNAIPSKRKILIVAAGFLSFVLVLGVILLMEFFDNTLKNDQRASEKLGLESMGMLPKYSISNGKVDMVRIHNRLMDFIVHNFMHTIKDSKDSDAPKIITVFSTGPHEGKTQVIGNIAKKLKANGKSVLFLNHSNSEKEEELVQSNVWLHRFLGYADPRVDYEHPFLDSVKNYLNDDEFQVYNVNDNFSRTEIYTDLNFENSKINSKTVDFILIELPNILEQNYPAKILENSDLAILVCRSNKLWSKADANILDNIKDTVKSEIKFIINGVAIEQVESLLGEIPKKRSKFRVYIKNLIGLQFFTKSTI